MTQTPSVSKFQTLFETGESSILFGMFHGDLGFQTDNYRKKSYPISSKRPGVNRLCPNPTCQRQFHSSLHMTRWQQFQGRICLSSMVLAQPGVVKPIPSCFDQPCWPYQLRPLDPTAHCRMAAWRHVAISSNHPSRHWKPG